MSKTCAPSELGDAIMDLLDEYDDYVNKVSPQSVRKVATRCRKRIKEGASGKFNGSKYASSWATKTTKKGEHEFEITVYSKMPGLPHLLENGHIKKTPSGRVLGRVDGRPHIKPAEVMAIEELENEIRRQL